MRHFTRLIVYKFTLIRYSEVTWHSFTCPRSLVYHEASCTIVTMVYCGLGGSVDASIQVISVDISSNDLSRPERTLIMIVVALLVVLNCLCEVLIFMELTWR